MTEMGLWLIGIILAMVGIGMNMYYQGKILLEPEKNETTGGHLKRGGKVLIGLAGFYLIIYTVFWQIIPPITS